MTTSSAKPSPIEVWLRQANMVVTCTIVHEDESTRNVDVESLSMRGAQREITGRLIQEGYTPLGRWAGVPAEGSRKFRLRRDA